MKAGLRLVKELADALGERRDRDVSIAALEDIAKAMAAPDRPGIETLVTQLRAEQGTANEVLGRLVGEGKPASSATSCPSWSRRGSGRMRRRSLHRFQTRSSEPPRRGYVAA